MHFHVWGKCGKIHGFHMHVIICILIKFVLHKGKLNLHFIIFCNSTHNPNYFFYELLNFNCRQFLVWFWWVKLFGLDFPLDFYGIFYWKFPFGEGWLIDFFTLYFMDLGSDAKSFFGSLFKILKVIKKSK